MKALIVFDSLYGNTERIAGAIGAALGADTPVLNVNKADAAALLNVDLLVVGSPTQGGRPSPAMKEWLARIPAGGLKGVRAAAFDTRFAAGGRGFAMRLLIRVVGVAAPRIAATLRSKGADVALEPEGFIVEGKEGPLQAGELERAAHWGQEVLQAAVSVSR